jgi:nucleotide-binding universal stress UspA family protein
MERLAPRRILAATDFSDLSALAVRHAVMWAQRFQAELLVLHAQEVVPIVDCGYTMSYSPELVEALEQAGVEQLKRCVEQCALSGVPISSQLTPGPAPGAIDACVKEHSVDLVVLGTHGRGGFSRLLLGSMAERVLRMAQYPTLIVRQLHPEAEAEATHVCHVLCPVNDTDVARVAFDHAATVARAFGAQLTAVFAVEPGHAGQEDQQREAERLQCWLGDATAVPCEVKLVVRSGDAAEEVIALAHEAQVDLVVIGAQHRRFADTTVLGVTTVRVTRHAPCPVLVVPRPSEV